jgi:hypothetical protein
MFGMRRNGADLLVGMSPLTYHHSYPVHRMMLRDTSAPPATNEAHFVDKMMKEMGKKRGKMVPGTGDPYVVAFLDWHYVPHTPKPFVHIDFAESRIRRKGYMRQLLDDLLLSHEDAPWIEFGAILHDDMWSYFQKRKAEGWRVYGKLR